MGNLGDCSVLRILWYIIFTYLRASSAGSGLLGCFCLCFCFCGTALFMGGVESTTAYNGSMDVLGGAIVGCRAGGMQPCTAPQARTQGYTCGCKHWKARSRRRRLRQ